MMCVYYLGSARSGGSLQQRRSIVAPRGFQTMRRTHQRNKRGRQRPITSLCTQTGVVCVGANSHHSGPDPLFFFSFSSSSHSSSFSPGSSLIRNPRGSTAHFLPLLTTPSLARWLLVTPCPSLYTFIWSRADARRSFFLFSSSLSHSLLFSVSFHSRYSHFLTRPLVYIQVLRFYARK